MDPPTSSGTWTTTRSSTRSMPARSLSVSASVPNGTCSGGETYLHVPGEVIPATANQVLAPDIYNQFRVQANYGSLSKKGFSTAASMAFDVKNNFVQGATIQSTYNWDCCGLTFEYCALGARTGAQRKCLPLRLQPHQRRDLRQSEKAAANLLDRTPFAASRRLQ